MANISGWYLIPWIYMIVMTLIGSLAVGAWVGDRVSRVVKPWLIRREIAAAARAEREAEL